MKWAEKQNREDSLYGSFFTLGSGFRDAWLGLHQGSLPNRSRSKLPLGELPADNLFVLGSLLFLLVFEFHRWDRLNVPLFPCTAGTLGGDSRKWRNSVCGCAPFPSEHSFDSPVSIDLAALSVTSRTALYRENRRTSARDRANPRFFDFLPAATSGAY
jgi:hypothetical protein